MIRHIALLLNFFLPGLGSFLLGKWRVGLAQLVLFATAVLSITYGFHGAYGWMVLVGVWAWGLFTAEYSPRTGGVKKTRRA